jgi:hypothetical protein
MDDLADEIVEPECGDLLVGLDLWYSVADL